MAGAGVEDQYLAVWVVLGTMLEFCSDFKDLFFVSDVSQEE